MVPSTPGLHSSLGKATVYFAIPRNSVANPHPTAVACFHIGVDIASIMVPILLRLTVLVGSAAFVYMSTLDR